MRRTGMEHSSENDDIRWVCKVCWEDTGEMVDLQGHPDGQGGGTWICEKGHVAGVWLNQGTLDLDGLR